MRNTIIQTRPGTRTRTVSFNASNSRILLAALVCLCGAASAQESRNVFEEIVVTAQHETAGTVKLMGVPMTFGAWHLGPLRPPPVLGRDTDEVLGELGYPPQQIAAWRAKRVI